MPIYRLFQFIGVAAIIWLFVTQVILPVVKGTRLFPLFGRRAKLEGELIKLRDEQEVVSLEREVDTERKNVNRLKTVRSVNQDDKPKEKV